MRSLYPAIKPYVRHTLATGSLHSIYVEECGNPGGIPVLFVHGGPGGGCEPWHRQFFDPARYRIVLFDQRGCGRSTPHAELKENHSSGLLGDMEMIREHLAIDRWLLFGGSWGSTLALLYAHRFPDQVLGLVVRGIFLCRQQDISWFYQQGASRLFPDHWQDFIAPISAANRDDLVAAYYELLTGPDELARLTAARAWSLWEARTSSLDPSPAAIQHFSNSHVALSMARIECHYFMNAAFIEPNQILDRAHCLQGIPGIIVHGRYDVVCPIDQAWALHRAWPQSQLEIVKGSGHSASEVAMIDALVRATDLFASQLS